MPKSYQRHNIFNVLVTLVSFSSLDCPADDREVQESKEFSYDWVPKSRLSPQQTLQLKPACSGLYVDPMANALRVDPATAHTYIDAGSVVMEDQLIHLDDTIYITQGDRRLSSQTMEFNQSSEQAQLQGDVNIRQKGLAVHGELAEINMAGREGQFSNAKFIIHGNHLRGQAKHIKQKEDNSIVLQEGLLTSCEPEENTWALKGKTITIDTENSVGYGKNIQIQLAGVPIFYTPYIAFPLGDKRRSGLLIPSISTNERGIDIAQPVYWNIAPNMDATLTPRFASGHGEMLESEFRHLNRSMYNEFAFGFIPDDEGDEDPDLEEVLQDPALRATAMQRQYAGEKRWIASWRHKGGDGLRWYSHIDAQRASDIDYLRDLEPASFSTAANTYLQQSLALGLRLPEWHISLSMLGYQNLLLDLDNSYRQLPRLGADGHYRWGNVALQLKHEYIFFAHEDELFLNNTPVITGERGRIHYALEWNKTASWGFFKPEIGVQGLRYALDDKALRAGANDRPSLATSYASVDTGLVFERTNRRQTLEPRLFYLYRDFTDHRELFDITADGQNINFDTSPLTFSYAQLFRSERYSGGDRLADAHRLTAGLTYRLFDDQGTNRLSLSIGQLFYFDDRSITLNNKADTLKESDLAFQIQAPINEQWHSSSDLLYNPDTSKMVRATINLTYRGVNHHDQKRLFSFGYRFLREQEQAAFSLGQAIDQLDVATYLPISPQWSLMGRFFYDLDEQKELDTFLGFEYESCCYSLRFLARRWLDSKLADLVKDDRLRFDEGLFMEIELKGLGSSGQRIQRLVRDSIIGFDN